MTEDKQEQNKGTLGIAKDQKLELTKIVTAGKIRQNFSHGRSKAVTFEVKKRRSLDYSSLEKEKKIENKQKLAEKTGLLESEIALRIQALQNAKKQKTGDENITKMQEKLANIQHQRNEQLAQEKQKAMQLLEEKQKIQTEQKKLAENALPSASPAKSVSTKETNLSLKDKSKNKTDNFPRSKESEEKEKKTEPPRKTLSTGKRDKHKSQHFSIADAMNVDDEFSPKKSLASLKRIREKKKNQLNKEAAPKNVIREVILPEMISVQELSNRVAIRSSEIIKKLMGLGIIANINQLIDADTAELVISEYNHKIIRVSESDIEDSLLPLSDDKKNLVSRSPVVTIMGHVDHGKTSLLDSIRKTDVVKLESGGITQHIGAYQVNLTGDKQISFIDTPGHAAFSEMRARGANVTDIVVLVVAADDGIKDQTVEAINHAQAANVPIIVAINKIDKPEAAPNNVKNELLAQKLIVEDLGGDIQCVEISALNNINIDKLEEAILLQAEILELSANPNMAAIGTVIEAKIDKGRGVIATVLVQKGTLTTGDVFVSGSAWGKVRAITDDKNKKLQSAGPSLPVEILGFSQIPLPGDSFTVVNNESRAREVAEHRRQKEKNLQIVAHKKSNFNNLLLPPKDNEPKLLSIIIKADAKGSAEAIVNSLMKIIHEEFQIKILHTGAGGINESDVTLANTANALIIGFNVRANTQAKKILHQTGIEVRYYSVIYNIIDDVRKILEGYLAPDLKEEVTGYLEVRNIFSISKYGKIAGCYVNSGQINNSSKVRLIRDNIVIHTGAVKSLKRFKEDSKVVKENYECGIILNNYQDIKVGDKMEAITIQQVAKKLT